MEGESLFLLEVLGYRDHCSQDYLVSSSVVFSCNFIFHKLTSDQWRRQSAADARAQHGHTTFASLVPRPRPAFSPLQYRNAEATRGVWGLLPQKILNLLSFLSRFWGY